jgi:hypothetical protein
MDVTTKKNSDQIPDLVLPGGCALCGGPVSVRVSPDQAYSVCIPCRWLTRAAVSFRPGGIEVVFSTTGVA